MIRTVLGIETSCDETSVAIYREHQGLLAHIIHSQVKLHQPYGGVVPELASRDHIAMISTLVKQVLAQAQLNWQGIDAIAYTKGPGLAGALLVGTSFAKSLAFSLSIPAIAVHHLQAHMLVAMVDQSSLTFPFLALIVSGGHTVLLQAEALNKYQILGETIDDACGEAFDKMAKHMGLSYPGGPKLAKLADKGNPHAYPLPRPMLDKGLTMSFSGLKTAGRQLWDQLKLDASEKNNKIICDFAASYQHAIVETLIFKTKKALDISSMKHLVLAGGVAANQSLRDHIIKLTEQYKVTLIVPPIELCTDNGAMIAYAGYLNRDLPDQGLQITIHPRRPVDQPI
jgi:N6-L-threonylcarbamoyladenine synthase